MRNPDHFEVWHFCNERVPNLDFFHNDKEIMKVSNQSVPHVVLTMINVRNTLGSEGGFMQCCTCWGRKRTKKIFRKKIEIELSFFELCSFCFFDLCFAFPKLFLLTLHFNPKNCFSCVDLSEEFGLIRDS